MLTCQFIKGESETACLTRARLTTSTGMLTSLGPKTLQEIQRNLESFADDYAQTQEELEVFLQAVRQEGLVDQKNDGKWILLLGE